MHVRRWFAAVNFAACTIAWATCAMAQPPAQSSGQLQIPADPRVEITGSLWNARPDALVSGAIVPGALASSIDFDRDLSIDDRRITELKVTLRLRPRHRLRVSFLPITLDADAVLERSVTLAGVRFDFGIPLNGRVVWRSLGVGYQYDVVRTARGAIGIIGEVRYTDARATVSSFLVAAEAADARGVFPVLGAIAHLQLTRRVALTTDFRGMRVPRGLVGDYRGHYVDLDVYGAVDLTPHLGLHTGYRVVDAGLHRESDGADLSLRGFYVTAAIRF